MPRYHGSYEGVDERRKQEHADGEMAPSGQGSFANMPETLVMSMYPKVHEHMPEDLNDGRTGVDRQISLDDSIKHKHMHAKKI